MSTADKSRPWMRTGGVVCAKCRFKSEIAFSPNGARCTGTDQYCLADYNGVNPLSGDKSPVQKIETEEQEVDHMAPYSMGTYKTREQVEVKVILLENVVRCTKRNPSGGCDSFVRKTVFERVQSFFARRRKK